MMASISPSPGFVASGKPRADGLTAALAERAAAWRHEALPEDARELVRQCLLDWVAVCVAGAHEPLTRMLAEECREQGGHPQATVVGQGFATSCRQAALVNGAAAHALDFDDVNMSFSGHPSVVLVPALLALAEARGASGAEFIAAFVAGYETMCRIGAAVSPGHYAAGFHATATIGTFGSAAACSHLLGLGAADTAVALGIAATEASGLKSMFGTMCKPLHAGRAAADGLMAAQLATRGFTSRSDAIEAIQGFAATHGPDLDPDAALRDPPGGLYLRQNLFKYHAACYGTHAAIEAARHLMDHHGLKVTDVERVAVHVSAVSDGVCNISEPRDGLEAKFSLRHAVAMALCGIDTAALENFSDERAADPELALVRERVRVQLHAECSEITQAEVVVKTRDGATLRHRYDAGVPETDLAAQKARLVRKFRAMAAPAISSEVCEQLLEIVERLDELPDLSPMAGLLSGVPLDATRH
ncbi:MmgE/PrpD family protein [Ramlibacter albus]|uniref:MmgE/PrpD family protein n=1 Tax=Ramlibacter albus TaxID=2079448 RepID=A0A923M2V0_9BURK|nr:MmgE/PrpD family protein [Ramlibacter albus]MBC5762903.1 MmgE/PrpD family protein [Ramlibacter albus]